MRPLRTLIIYIAVVFVGGALLAPWLYWLAQAVAGTFPSVAHAALHRFVNRSLLFVALAGLWPLLRGLGARSLGDLGLAKPAGNGRNLLSGFLAGFISLAVVATLAFVGGARVFEKDLSIAKVAEMLLRAAFTAATVAVLEEILFRGGIFGGLKRVWDWRFALVLSSGVYALLHFLAKPTDKGDVTWTSGLALLPQMLAGFADWRALLPGFFNLTLAGMLLALAYQRTGNLYFSIGLHAGWIFWLRSYGALTTAVPRASQWFWGSGRLIDGWVAFVVLAATLGVFARLPIARESKSVSSS